jgi:hypothetical protein
LQAFSFFINPLIITIMSQHIKTHDGYDVKVPTQGQTDLNTVLGALGTASFAGLDLKSLIGRLGGGNIDTATLMTMLAMMQGQQRCACSEDHCVNRYELAMEKEIASKDSKIALLEANTYNDQKTLELYKYIDGKLNEINARLSAQDVRNQGFVDAFRELQKDLDNRINLEAERRECADNKIVCYANSVFAPKLVADYTAGTTTTAMTTFNPLCCCGK